MIISRSYNYVFLHVRKAAGSSVKVGLAKSFASCDEMAGCWHEVIAQGGGLTDAVRRRLNSLVGYSTYLGYRAKRVPQPVAINQAIRASYLSQGIVNPQHATAEEVRRCFPDIEGTCLWFAVMRDPWERLYSEYRWRCRALNDQSTPFEDYVSMLADGRSSELLPKGVTNVGKQLRFSDGSLAVDNIIKADYLQEGLDKICSHLGHPKVIVGREKISGFEMEEGAIGRVYSSCRQEAEAVLKDELEIYESAK